MGLEEKKLSETYEDAKFFGDLSFSKEVDLGDLQLEQEQIDCNKIFKKKHKYFFSRSSKIASDIEEIKNPVEDVGKDEQLEVVSKAFDSPNIIKAFADDISELYVATWAVTPAGIACISEIKGLKKGIILLDKTHSYKWVFQSGAYKFLQGKIKFKFSENHSKFILIKFNDKHGGGVLNFIGSFNLSNNPRYENLSINRSVEAYEFYRDFIINCSGTIV